jgi:hypothetical protein
MLARGSVSFAAISSVELNRTAGRLGVALDRTSASPTSPTRPPAAVHVAAKPAAVCGAARPQHAERTRRQATSREV